MHKAGAFTFLCAGLLAFPLLPVRPAVAAWPHDPIVNVPLCTATGEQSDVHAVSDGAGGAIVVWVDQRSGVGSWFSDIYAQRISADGAIQWATDGVVICNAANVQSEPTIVSDGAGGAIVTWQDYRSGTSYDLYTQRILAGGVVHWAANGRALCTSTGDQLLPMSVTDGAGGAVITWEDYRTGITTSDVYAQRISSAGSAYWTVGGAAVCNAADFQQNPLVVSDGAGGAIITWWDARSGVGSDIYAQRVSAAGAGQWTVNGVALCTAYAGQSLPTIVSDGAGGAIVAWQDGRSATSLDTYVQRISAGGAVQWTADGVALSTATGHQEQPRIVSDGASGAIVVWQSGYAGSYDIYAQRISTTGAGQWPVNGVALCTATGDQQYPEIVSDGASGAIVTWQDARSGESHDIYARRISATGTALGAATGAALCTDASDQFYPAIASDGNGGAIVAWYEERQGDNDIYAQQVGAEPAIRSVTDIPADQGGKVRIEWAASWLETPSLGISIYGLWRQVEESAALQVIGATGRLASAADGPAEARPGTFRTTMNGTSTLYWEGLGSVVTHGEPTYTFTTFTFEDSTAASNPYSVFMVDYQATYWPTYWSSEADSGYSVDNLAPAMPAPFTGQYASGTTTLHWGLSAAADFSTYKLYRGTTAEFVPSPRSLIATPRDTGYVDSPGTPRYYKLSAVDIHGNESPFALLQPSETADAPADGPLAFALEGVRPNPSRGERLSVAFTLLTSAPARLELVDVSGRRVVEREVGSLGAGRCVVDLAAGRRLAPGLYLVRLTQGANDRVARVVVLE